MKERRERKHRRIEKKKRIDTENRNIFSRENIEIGK